jgi:hypothetical protein
MGPGRVAPSPDSGGIREILSWLNGGYRITDEIVRTQ